MYRWFRRFYLRAAGKDAPLVLFLFFVLFLVSVQLSGRGRDGTRTGLVLMRREADGFRRG